MATKVENAAPAGGVGTELKNLWNSFMGLPWTVKLTLVALVVLYYPVLAEAAHTWINDENQSHGIFIIPIVIFLLWLLRDRIRAAVPAPTAWGVVLLGFGLLVLVASFLLRLKLFPMLSLVPVVAGLVLALHGKNLMRVVLFPVLFLGFAAPLPDAITLPVSAAIQRASTDVSAWTMVTLGYPLVQTGNRIDTPTISVEVAEVCSGFKKLTALIAFSFLYGYMFNIGMFKRAALVASAPFVALFANVIRVCALIFIGSTWGTGALKAAHDYAEMGVLVVAFFTFIGIGKLIGCQKLRFFQS